MSGLQAAHARPRGVAPVVRLRLRRSATLDLERVPESFGPALSSWLGEQMPDDGSDGRRFLCDLELHAGGRGPTLFRKAAVVWLGDLQRSKDGWVVPIEWRASSFSPLFPVFVGRLKLAADRVELEGCYAPPGGRLGYALDAALLGAAARQTGRWFMRRLTDALA